MLEEKFMTGRGIHMQKEGDEWEKSRKSKGKKRKEKKSPGGEGKHGE